VIAGRNFERGLMGQPTQVNAAFDLTPDDVPVDLVAQIAMWLEQLFHAQSPADIDNGRIPRLMLSHFVTLPGA
jgi:hypothetical protein